MITHHSVACTNTLPTPTFLSVTALLGCLLLPLAGCKSHRFSIPGMAGHRKSTSKPNTTEYSDNLQQVAGSPQLTLLKWSGFSDDQPAVQQFYQDRNWELAWTRNGKPTAAATALIQTFTDADKKGLRPEDYDGQQWQAHLQALAGASQDQNTVAQFDVAMTLTAIRFLDDLHLGRIQPAIPELRQSMFPQNVPPSTSPRCLNDQLVDAGDVGSVIASVEPQNAMYKKTEDALATLSGAGRKGGLTAAGGAACGRKGDCTRGKLSSIAATGAATGAGGVTAHRRRTATSTHRSSRRRWSVSRAASA